MPLDCTKYEDLLVEEALGEIGERERVFLKAHLDGCAECRATLAGLADTIGALKRERHAPAPAGLAQRTMKRVEATGERFMAAASPYHQTSLLKPGTWQVRKSLVAWMVAASIVVMVTAGLVPGINGGSRSSDVISCQNNMRLIAAALRQYAFDHNGFFPEGPQWYTALDQEYLGQVNALLCPARLAVGAPSSNATDYVYSPSRASIGDAEEYPILWDRKAAHDQLGRNVMRVNGTITWMDEEEFEKLLIKYKIDESQALKPGA